MRAPSLSGIDAEDRQLAVGARRHGGDHAHRRGLAGAVRAEEAERLRRAPRRSRCASTAVKSPKRLVRPRARISGAVLAGIGHRAMVARARLLRPSMHEHCRSRHLHGLADHATMARVRVSAKADYAVRAAAELAAASGVAATEARADLAPRRTSRRSSSRRSCSSSSTPASSRARAAPTAATPSPGRRRRSASPT